MTPAATTARASRGSSSVNTNTVFGRPVLGMHPTLHLVNEFPARDTSDRLELPQTTKGTELVTRLLAQRCEICRGTEDISVHHVRSLADLDGTDGPRPVWTDIMARRRRKTLVVCRNCHRLIHTGTRQPQLTE